jgi:hypothetical protein
MPVTPQKDTEIVKGGDNAGEFHTIDEKYRQRYLLLADGVEKEILQVLRTFRHGAAAFLFSGPINRLIIRSDYPERHEKSLRRRPPGFGIKSQSFPQCRKRHGEFSVTRRRDGR